jgi:hypothetical protein
MNEEIFWMLIEQTHQASGANYQNHRTNLIDALSQFTGEDIQEFDRILFRMMSRAYRADLWNAVSLIACWCSDDSFEDFCNWLIAQGQAIYERVLADPETLVDLVDKDNRLHLFEGWIIDTAQIAYEHKFGRPIPETGYAEKSVLVGKLLPENELPERFPRIATRFGSCDEEDLFS